MDDREWMDNVVQSVLDQIAAVVPDRPSAEQVEQTMRRLNDVAEVLTYYVEMLASIPLTLPR